MIEEYQIAQLLQVAKARLAYAKISAEYPKKIDKQGYDPTVTIDRFYKNICNTFFSDSLLIIWTLLNKDRKKRTISLWHYDKFLDKKQQELEKLTNKFINTGLKNIRDQVLAHQDINHKSNEFPNFRIRWIIDSKLIETLEDLLSEIIKEFCDFAKKFSTPYSDQYFTSAEANAIEEIELAMNQAKPILTDNFLI